jgi:nucleotide-binding universal stress UspA family protein
MTHKKILAAVDRSPLGATIFEEALEIARQNNAQLKLFYCVPLNSVGMSDYTNLYGEELVNFSQIMQQELDQEIKEVSQWLGDYSEKAIAQGITSDWEWKLGDAGSWICDTARKWQADLIVIGRRGRLGLTEMFLGSVSNYVIHHAPCSVLVVQGTQPPAEEELQKKN